MLKEGVTFDVYTLRYHSKSNNQVKDLSSSSQAIKQPWLQEVDSLLAAKNLSRSNVRLTKRKLALDILKLDGNVFTTLFFNSILELEVLINDVSL